MQNLISIFENYLTFKPKPEFDEAAIPSGYQRCKIKVNLSEKEQELDCLYSLKPDASYIVVNCHGNASNLSQLEPLYRFYEKVGCSFFAFDYPGYGLSTGKPSEENLNTSLAAVISHVKNELGFAEHQIVLHGISLGGAVAVEGLTQNNFLCAIIDASFTNNVEMARFMFPALPLWRLIKPKFDSLRKVKNIDTPILFVHGEADEVIPHQMSDRLYEAKSGQKKLIKIPKASHSDEVKISDQIYIDGFRDFVESCLLNLS